MLVAEADQVAAIAEAVAAAPLAAFDLEFLTADRLIPQLCVLQVAWVGVGLDAGEGAIVAAAPEVRLVDALAVDVRPLLEALAGHPTAIAHAVRQDLGIVGRLGIAMPGIVDTQVMAAFASVGDQVGLGALVSELLGVTLAKEQQWTDWAKRPLSQAQLAYAAADVLHLPAVYAKLATRLGDRLAWARAESAVVAGEALAAARMTPEDAWRAITLRGLDAPAVGAVRALAAWRMRVAIELDRPLGWVLSERSLIELARQRPGEPEAVRALKGLAQPARQRAEELVALLATVVPGEEVAPGRPASTRAQRWAEMLLAIVQIVSEQTGVAMRLLATRSDAEEFARAFEEGGSAAIRRLPAMVTWRVDLIGRRWEAFLTGKLALSGAQTASGLVLIEEA